MKLAEWLEEEICTHYPDMLGKPAERAFICKRLEQHLRANPFRVRELLPDGSEWNEYQDWVKSGFLYPGAGENLVYPTLGIVGEAGEFADKVKKIQRGDYDMSLGMPEEVREALIKELGDVLWYVAAAAYELGVTLSHVVETNIIKLNDRTARGVRRGSGDDR